MSKSPMVFNVNGRLRRLNLFKSCEDDQKDIFFHNARLKNTKYSRDSPLTRLAKQLYIKRIKQRNVEIFPIS